MVLGPEIRLAWAKKLEPFSPLRPVGPRPLWRGDGPEKPPRQEPIHDRMPSFSTEIAVVGGGATGLGIAWDACLRGYKVLVLEQADLGEGTSGRYHGLLHSGARYSVSDPVSAADCSAENPILRRIAAPYIEDTGGLFVLLPNDPPLYVPDWLAGCRRAGIPTEEISATEALRREPALPRALARAFRVADAALDSFELLHALCRSIEGAGGQVWIRREVRGFIRQGSRVVGVQAEDRRTGDIVRIQSELVINAAGPWAGKVAGRAGIRLPLALSRGAMLALASRPVHTVINRCAYPGDGDIVVPIGTVAVLGTTDESVRSPERTQPEGSEIHSLLRLGQALLPDLPRYRPLRAWVGVRPLYRPSQARSAATRELPRAHHILDHETLHDVPGLITVLGGKLTTYRRMAEQTVDLAEARLGRRRGCTTATTPLQSGRMRRFHALSARLTSLDAKSPAESPAEIVCECELVERAEIGRALEAAPTTNLDDLRRDLRLGMGPCQAAFCGYRAAGIVAQTVPRAPSDGGLLDFLEERWRGTRLLTWGSMLRQLEFQRRVSLELLGAAPPRRGRT